MTPRAPETYRELAEASWRWVLEQVQWDDGPWIPVSVTHPPVTGPAWDRDGFHSGVAGLVPVLAEIRLTRAWTAEEQRLADGIAERLLRTIPTQTDCTFFDGLVSTIGALTALAAPGADLAVARLTELAEPDGWPQTALVPPKYPAGARINDLTLGTAGVLLGAVWAHRHGVSGAADLAGQAATVLLAEAEVVPTGTTWRMIPPRFAPDRPESPNLSHGVAGVATALALGGDELDRPELVEAARRGAEHLVSLGDTRSGGLLVPRTVRDTAEPVDVTFTWCHGPTGTSLLFPALAGAGIADVAGRPPLDWHRRCLHSVRTSGLPARLTPGFWDNDGRCCGTAGVGDVFLDSWQRTGQDDDLDFALHLADTLVERAVHQDDRACWRFIEHAADDPLLPPGVGWMQGAAGISAYLFRASRVVEHGTRAEPVPRMDNWWALPAQA